MALKQFHYFAVWQSFVLYVYTKNYISSGSQMWSLPLAACSPWGFLVGTLNWSYLFRKIILDKTLPLPTPQFWLEMLHWNKVNHCTALKQDLLPCNNLTNHCYMSWFRYQNLFHILPALWSSTENWFMHNDQSCSGVVDAQCILVGVISLAYYTQIFLYNGVCVNTIVPNDTRKNCATRVLWRSLWRMLLAYPFRTPKRLLL